MELVQTSQTLVCTRDDIETIAHFYYLFISDSEREQRKPQRKDKPKPIRRQTAELSSAPESEDYVREKSAKTKKRRPRAPAGETGAGGAEDGAPKKKRKKKAASPQPDVPLTQEEGE